MCDDIIAHNDATVRGMWHKEHIFNFSVPQRVHLFIFFIFFYFFFYFLVFVCVCEDWGWIANSEYLLQSFPQHSQLQVRMMLWYFVIYYNNILVFQTS
jgi:hypothetical protein